MDVDTIWTNFLNQIKSKITSLSYSTWFDNTSLVSLENACATILVPSGVHQKHLTDTYSDIIKSTLNEITGTNFDLEFKVVDENDNQDEVTSLDGVPNYSKEETNLISKYTFDNYVVGESNKFAHAAAVAIAENPGKVYNPLFLYGKSGLGKTHLMHAIGNHIATNTNKKVLYVTSEQFISDFSGISRKNNKDNNNFSSTQFFKNKYRNIDLLIIDDIQFLGSAEKTQTEFFHTFNNLYDDNKQIIISSDRSPDDLKLLEERLRTRFGWGLRVNIFPPDLKLREDIIRSKISETRLSMDLPDNVIEYIAQNLTSDVRQIEGAITRLYAYCAMFSIDEITSDVAMSALKDQMTITSSYKNDLHKIQTVVCDFYKITIDDIKSKRKTNKIAHPRQIAMYLSRTLTEESFPKIGIEYGGRDHSTVIHAVDKIKKESENDEELKKTINMLIEKIKSL